MDVKTTHTTAKTLSQRDYAQRRTEGNSEGVCPRCQQGNVGVGEIVPTAPGRLEERMACLDCGLTWYEVYTYTRYVLA